MFVDRAVIEVKGGKGGDGAVHFRREKYISRGGPDGGDGGDGGSVFVRASSRKKTLYDVAFQPLYQASSGEPGQGKNRKGAKGEDIVLEVPVGTQVFDAESGELLADLIVDEMEVLVAQGGRGGRGNASFATPTNRAPRVVLRGEEGEHRKVRLELKLIADVGLTGLPNAGKSTLLSAVSEAKPRIASYPFSTLHPTLGVVKYRDESFIMVDVPGIIEGASRGAGLGLEFLRHVERVRLLLCLVDVAFPYSGEPWKDFLILRQEFAQYHPSLLEKPFIVVGTKLDLPEGKSNWKKFKKKLSEENIEGVGVSAVSYLGIDELLDKTLLKLRTPREETVTSLLQERGEKRPPTPSPRVYRFASLFLERLLEEAPLEKGERIFCQRLQESGFLKYLKPLPPQSIVEIGSYQFTWTGKELVLVGWKAESS
ncbi:MAG: GTPase ObgE [Candidatus Caldatribacteriaceae bacterium]